MKEESLFVAALEKSSAAERQVYLDEACGGNLGLRERVEQLLAADDSARGILRRDADGAPRPIGHLEPVSIAEGPGTLIGPYKLKELIGEGGFGLVFVAEQQQPVRRKVALKIIKPGMDTRDVSARFEAERQALALMDHPSIARIFDAGSTESGRPYFVMELVRGVAINEYCDEQQLTTRERLELFTSVCHAVQHAHQKGVIHRDLKPSNVLVALHDSKPVPKVIDFGVAKALNQQLTDHSVYTRFAQMVGTPAYMSPEQAKMSALDVDTRSDIYSLGVMLYELLTGSTPFDKKRLATVGFDEMRRIIREEEPEKPSTRLSHSKDTLVSLAAQRRTEPIKLQRLMRGELDWIVMKALEKDRTHRYETANDMARDLHRYLRDEPVEASPPSSLYRLRKLVRRNQGAVLAASIMVLLLIGGIIGTTVGMVRAEWARADEAARAEGERLAKVDAEKAWAAEAERATGERLAKETAEKRLSQIEKGMEILGSIFFELHPRSEEKEGLPLRAILGKRLDQAAADLEGEAVGDPLVVAGLQMKLAQSQLGLGYPEKAIPLFIKARATYTRQLGVDHMDTLNSMNGLGQCYLDAARLDLALPLFEETLKLRRIKLGPNHFDTHQSMNNLAMGYQEAGNLDLALPLFEETVKNRTAMLGADHPVTLMNTFNLATCYRLAGKQHLARPLHEEVFKLRKAKLGVEHAETLQSMFQVAFGYQQTGRLDLAVPLSEQVLRLRQAKLGADHPDTLLSMNGLGKAYQRAGRNDQAVSVLEEALKLTTSKRGPDHTDTLDNMENLALAYRAVDKLDLALPLLEEVLKRRKAKLDPEHPDVLMSMNSLAALYWSLRKLDQSIPLFEGVLAQQRQKLGDDHHATLATAANLGVNYRDVGRLSEALPLLEEAHRKGKQHPSLGWIGLELVSVYIESGKPAEATALLQDELASARRRLRADSPELGSIMARAGSQLLELKRFGEAEALLRECLTLREEKQPDMWWTFGTKSALGAALLGQKKYAEAEPLLLAGYEGLKAREAKIPLHFRQVRLPEALDRLVQLYAAWDKPEEAAKWRMKLETARGAAGESAKPK